MDVRLHPQFKLQSAAGHSRHNSSSTVLAEHFRLSNKKKTFKQPDCCLNLVHGFDKSEYYLN